MGKIWSVWMLLAICATLGTGQWQQAETALLTAGSEAIRLGVTLTGSMMVWGGLMGMLRDTPIMGILARGLRRLLSPLVRRDLTAESWAAMGMNLAANLLGLGNAATPFGIRAATLLAQQGESGMRGLLTLLVLNNSGLSLMPTTVITLRQQAGSAAPGDIWLPTLIATAVATLAAALMLRLTDWGKKHG